jgi:hypothetical protein
MNIAERECFNSAVNYLEKKERLYRLSDLPYSTLSSKEMAAEYNKTHKSIAYSINKWFDRYDEEEDIDEEEKELYERNKKTSSK